MTSNSGYLLNGDFSAGRTYQDRQRFFLQTLLRSFKGAFKRPIQRGGERCLSRSESCVYMAGLLFENAGCEDSDWTDPFEYGMGKGDDPNDKPHQRRSPDGRNIKYFSECSQFASFGLFDESGFSRDDLIEYLEDTVFLEGSVELFAEKWGLAKTTPPWVIALGVADAFYDIAAKPLRDDLRFKSEVPDGSDWGDVRAKIAGDGALQELEKKLSPLCGTSKQESLRNQPFVGREWLQRDVSEWARSELSQNICLIAGDSGVGKSAFAAYLTGEESELPISAAVFCETRSNREEFLLRAMRALAFGIAQNSTLYRNHLITATKDGNFRSMSLEDFVEELFTVEEARRAIECSNGPVIIIIDGLDEAGSHNANELAEVLANYSNRLPGNLKVLITSKREASVTDPLQHVAYRIDIDGLHSDNLDDIRTYFYTRLEEFSNLEGFASAVEQLVERSGGSFLYASLVADAVVSRTADLGDVDYFPIGLKEALRKWFAWTFPDKDEFVQRYRAPLGCIAAAPMGALPIAELRVLFGWSAGETSDFLRGMGAIVRKGNGVFGEYVVLSHQFVADWVVSGGAGPYQCFIEDAVALMARRYHELTSAVAGSASLGEYGFAVLYTLLYEAGMRNELEEDWLDEGIYSCVLEAADSLIEKRLYEEANEVLKGLIRCDRAFYEEHFTVAHSRLTGLELLHQRLLMLTGRFEEAKSYAESTRIARWNTTKIVYPGDSLGSLGYLNAARSESTGKDGEALLLDAVEANRLMIETDPDTYAIRCVEALGVLSEFYTCVVHCPEKAVAASQDAISVVERAYPEGHHFLKSHCLDNLANNLRSAGRTEESLVPQRESVAHMRELANEHPEQFEGILASSLEFLALMLDRAGFADEAERTFEESLGIAKSAYGRDDNSMTNAETLIDVLLAFGDLLAGRPERTGDALGCYLNAVELAERHVGELGEIGQLAREKLACLSDSLATADKPDAQ